ncbi:MAG: T9SS type A sorting domain-containing protein [Candidatus Cloacimonadaceae bacterium]|nr:T9SS type A sorting domain-containing protein [Candidatus Cloacimonadaceae bacterium]
MAIRGHYAYLVNYQNGWRLQIYDVSQSSSIQLVGELPLNSNHSATHIRLVGNILFLGAQYITLIDVSNPGAPSLISQYDFSFSVRDLATASNALIVLNSFELSVYDISSPLDPQLVASTTLGSRALDMVLRDGKAYVGHYDYVACYDLSEALAICAASGIGNDVPPPEPGIYCYPNPFQGSAILRVDLKEPGSYELTIYNLRGQPVRRFTDLISQNGSSTLIWNGEDDKGKPLPSGIYLVNAQNGKQSLRSKLILMK